MPSTHGVVLAQHGAPLTVAEHSPGDLAVLELGNTNLAGEGAIGLVKDVLRGHLNLPAQVLARKQQVERGRGDDDFGIGVQLGGIEVGYDVLDLLDGAIPAHKIALLV